MKKYVSLVLIILMISVMLCVCFVGCAEKLDDGVIKLSEVTHSVFYAPLYVAIEMGFFKDVGIELELTNAGGADKCMTALLAGQVDIAFCGPEAGIYVYNEGRVDYPHIFAQMTKKDGSFLMSREPIEDFKWSMLENKNIIGGRKGGIPALSLEHALKKNNLINNANVTINYDIQFDLIAPAFEGGTGDFCTMFEPAASNMQKQGKGYIVSSVGKEAGNMPFTVFMATPSYMNNNPNEMSGFMKGIYRGMRFVANNSAKVIAKTIAPSFVGTSEEILESAIESYKSIGAYSEHPHMIKEEFESLQNLIFKAGIIDKVADYDMLYIPDYAENVKWA